MDSRQFERQVRKLTKKNPRVRVTVSSQDLVRMQQLDEARRTERRAQTEARYAEIRARTAANRVEFNEKWPVERATDKADHEERMRQLSPWATRLHRRAWAIPLLVLSILSLALIAIPYLTPLYIALFVAIAVVDFHNVATLHGWLPWRAWRRSGTTGMTIAYGVGFVYFFFGLFLLVPIVYFIQAIRLAPAMREYERKRLQTDIARLEAELRRPTPAAAVGAPAPAAPAMLADASMSAPGEQMSDPTATAAECPATTSAAPTAPKTEAPTAPATGKSAHNSPKASSPRVAKATRASGDAAPTPHASAEPPAALPGEAIAHLYIAAWNQRQEGQRDTLLASCWAEQGTFTEDDTTLTGREALSTYIAGYVRRYPGNRLQAATGPTISRNAVRLAWAFIDADGATVSTGQDFGELAPDGRLAKMTRFVDLPTAK